MDPIEAAIWRCGISPSVETGIAAYEVAAVLAENQPKLGLTMIADAVKLAGSGSGDVAPCRPPRRCDCARVIKVVCSDAEVHRRRLTGRIRTTDGFPEPTWDDVLARKDEWERWQEDRVVLDATEPLTDNVERALAYVPL